MAYYGDSLNLLYVGDVHTSQETRLCSSTAFYADSLNLLYVGDVHTSQETRLCSSTACYGDSFQFLGANFRLNTTGKEIGSLLFLAVYGPQRPLPEIRVSLPSC
jgi:hypothetical protein